MYITLPQFLFLVAAAILAGALGLCLGEAICHGLDRRGR